MSNITKFPDGVLVKCPGCLAEVPAHDGPEDGDRPFRCSMCRARSGEVASRIVPSVAKGDRNRGNRKQSDSDVPNPPIDAGERATRDREAQ